MLEELVSMQSKLRKAIAYAVHNPHDFIAYFFGRPALVLANVTGASSSRIGELYEQLSGTADFIQHLKDQTFVRTGETYRLNKDHKFLYALVRLIRPLLTVETGVFDGYFSACILQGLQDNAREGIPGRLISIDLPAYQPIAASTTRCNGRTSLPAGCAPGWVIPDWLGTRWELHIGDSRELLPELVAGAQELDLFFHDSLHTYEHMLFEFATAWPSMRSGGVLLSHDVHWNRAFRHFLSQYGQTGYAAHGFGAVRKR